MTFDDGETSKTIEINPVPDDVAERPETVVAYLEADAPYLLNTPKEATLTITDAGPLDLDTDSDNDGTIALADDPIEDDADKPGKILAVNDDDADGDGIPDFADGFNRDGVAGNDDDAIAGDVSFVPVEVSVPLEWGLSGLRLSFNYDEVGSYPWDVVRSGSGTSEPYTYAPGGTDSSLLRLWTLPGSAARSRNVPSDGGHFIISSLVVDASLLQWTISTTDPTKRTTTLWAEAVRPSAALADIEITATPSWTSGTFDPHRDARGDTVRMTAFRTQLLSLQPNGELVPTDATELSHPTPVFSNVVISPAIRRSADNKRILADVTLSANLADAASDLISGTEGKIRSITLTINGGSPRTIVAADDDVEKGFDPESILRPYPFGATFAPDSFEVELQPGVNLFRLVATNAYGLSGFAEQSIELLVTPPPDQTYDYEIRVGDDPYANPSLGVGVEFRTRPAGGAWTGWRALSRQDADTFIGADGVVFDVVLDQPMDGSGPEFEMWTTVTDAATENGGEVIPFGFDRIEQDQGMNKTTWKGQWTREEHDLEDLSRHDITRILQPPPVVLSTTGSFYPVIIEMQGPDGLFDQVILHNNIYDLIEYNEHRLLAHVNGKVPRAFLSTANLKALASLPQTPNDEPEGMTRIDAKATGGAGDFALGVGAGLLWTIPDTVIGLWDGVKFVGKQYWENLPIRIGYRWATTGDPRTVEDQRRWETTKGVAVKVAEVVAKIELDRQEFIYALQTGDEQTLRGLGEEYRVAFEFAAEMLDSIWDEIAALPKYEQGKIVGRVVGEVVLTVGSTAVTAGGALAAKGATMLGVATKLKQVKLVDNAALLQRLVGKLNKLIESYNKIENWTDGLDNVNDGKAIAQRAFSIILRNKQPNEGYWQAFERFLAATSDPKRRALVDSHLGFIANRIMRESYKEAAVIIRGGGTVAQAMQKVPTYNRIKAIMAGRREVAWLDAHHAIAKEQGRFLLRNIPEYANLTKAQLDTILDDAPALLMDKAWHRMFDRQWFRNVEMPEEWAFHDSLRRWMAEADLDDNDSILDAMRRAYREHYGLEPIDPDPDVWVVAEKWFRELE